MRKWYRSRRLLDGVWMVSINQLRPDSRPIVRPQIPARDSASGGALDGGAPPDRHWPSARPPLAHESWRNTELCRKIGSSLDA